jgi:hypothetical protein
MESDFSYFKRRASEERAAALSASDPDAQMAHLEMAARYEDLVHGIGKHDEFLGLQSVHGRT